MHWPSNDEDDVSVQGADVDSYIRRRLTPQRLWYSRKAKRCKRWYITMQILAVIIAVFLPLATVEKWGGGKSGVSVATVLGLVIGLLASVESVIHLREQWRNYRATEQYLERECMYFGMGAGAYRGSHTAAAAALLVDRCETAIASENTATLNLMTTPSQMSADGQPPPPSENGTGTEPLKWASRFHLR